MNILGLNRAALNGGLSTIVAGAALVAASSGMAADGTRVVLPSAAVIANSAASADGLRTRLGAAGLIVSSSGSAEPALLQLQSATIVVSSQLKATYTNALIAPTSALQADGFIIRPGAAVSAATSTGTAAPLVIVGYTSTINVTSSGSADASVKLNGQTTWQHDGYARIDTTSSLSANGLRTALATAYGVSTSDCTTDSIKIHGGAARIECRLDVSVVASTDAARAVTVSDFTASPTVTQFADAVLTGVSSATAAQTVMTFGVVETFAGLSECSADGRLAELGAALISSSSDGAATGLLALQGAAAGSAACVGTADGTIYQLAQAHLPAHSAMTASWVILRDGAAAIVARSTLAATAMTNAEALDPPSRTVSRPFTSREVRRPYTNREMKRSA